MQKRSFGRTKEGREVTEYTLVNAQGMTLSVIDLGATIVSITMKGSDGNVYDVVLGYDTPVDYQNNTCYFGAVIGRNANRIDHAHIHLDGKDYSLEANDNENNLHSGSHGFHAVIWDVVQESAQSITFSYVSRDGEQDFPGNMTAKVTYTLDDNGEVAIAYEAVCDQTTVANFTNHAYFNLDGHDSGVMEGQKLELHASYYTPVIDSKAIPTGELAKVAGTPFDFREMKRSDGTSKRTIRSFVMRVVMTTIMRWTRRTVPCSLLRVPEVQSPASAWMCIRTVWGSSSIPATLSRRRPARAACSTASAMHSVWRRSISRMR